MIEPKATPARSALLRRPRGIRLTGVDYAAYVKMRDARGNDHLRMAYRNGVLWIMSPQYRHDRGASLLGLLVDLYALTTNLECEAAGSTTFRKGDPRGAKGEGKEGDETFYLGVVATLVRGKNDLILPEDPPPSLWVEVDNFGDSTVKLPLYAALRVPEVWQYRVRRRTLKFWRLEEGVYNEIPESLALPGLTPAMVLELLDEAARRGRTGWMAWLLHEWFPQNRALFPDFRDRQP